MASLIKQGKLLNGRPQEKWRSDSEEEDQKRVKLKRRNSEDWSAFAEQRLSRNHWDAIVKLLKTKKTAPRAVSYEFIVSWIICIDPRVRLPGRSSF